jgi:murein DD-endopeptidase MepM/ murein hydrolase activator NlpD
VSLWAFGALAAAAAGVLMAAWVIATSRRIRGSGRGGALQPADAIVVFGAAVWRTGPSLSLQVRIDRAAEVYKAGWAPTILCSGGWSGGASEARVMRDRFLSAGVPAAAILMDDGGMSTRLSVRSAKLFGLTRGWRRVIAVSSSYHMYRIGLDARRQGLDVILCPASRTGARTLRLMIFDTRQHIREIRAIAAYSYLTPFAALFSRGLGRRIRTAVRHLAARWRWLMREADAVVAASDEIGDRIKEQSGVSDAGAVASPATMSLAWPIDGEVISRFGLRHRRLHAGMDIRGIYGSEIRAAASGRVLLAENIGPYGNVSAIDHGAGLATVYSHQAGFLVDAGASVGAGQVIGVVGETGRSFGPHLHFEVRVHGAPVDPLVYLPVQSGPPPAVASAGHAAHMGGSQGRS